VSATATGTAMTEAFLKQVATTKGDGNEGAVVAAAFLGMSGANPLPATATLARLVVEPLPGTQNITLSYVETLRAATGDSVPPVRNVIVRVIGTETSETLVPSTTSRSCKVCPAAGDTHCLGIDVAGPEGDVPGTYLATASASDDSGDPIIYTFSAKRGDEAPILVGPQANASASFDLGIGTWTISVDVDDDPTCPDVAADAQRSTVVEVVPPGGLRLPGDANGDGGLDISDAVAALGFLFLGNPEKLPCGDGSATDTANIQLIDWQPDAAIDISDAVGMLTFLFLGGPPHPLAVPGEETKSCVRIFGCQDHCGQ